MPLRSQTQLLRRLGLGEACADARAEYDDTKGACWPRSPKCDLITASING